MKSVRIHTTSSQILFRVAIANGVLELTYLDGDLIERLNNGYLTCKHDSKIRIRSKFGTGIRLVFISDDPGSRFVTLVMHAA